MEDAAVNAVDNTPEQLALRNSERTASERHLPRRRDSLTFK